MKLTIPAQAALWVWFLGCTTTWRVGGRLLVEGMGVRSAEFGMLCAYTLGCLAFHFFPPAGKWILSALLTLWAAVQFFCHWYYTLFGASAEKLKGYNECFRGTVRIFPESETRLIPDFYHIVLHILILVNIVFCLR